MGEHKSFKYYLPQFGEIEAFIWKPYAVNCYKLLHKKGHIKRMGRMDQLGVIRNVYQGAHHHRWEYVVLQLYLLNLLQDSNLNIGTNSNIELIDGIEFSGIEILQMWVLLLNAGHLPGTFSTEKAIMKYCKTNRLFKNSILNGIPDDKKQWFKEQLKNENLYEVHRILICFHLERYKRLSCYDVDGNSLIDILQRVLSFFVIDAEEESKFLKQIKLRHVYNMIRRVSYLFLDSQYAPFPISFSLSRMLVNVNVWLDDLISIPPSPIVKTLDAFENLLSMNLYHSAHSIRELGYHVNRIEELLEKNMDVKRLDTISNLHKFLIEDESYKFQPVHGKEWKTEPFHVFFDIHSDPSIKKFFRSYLSFEAEKQLNHKLGDNACQLTFQSSNDFNHFVINLNLLTENEERNMKVIGKFVKFITELSLDAKKQNKSQIIDYIKKPYEELLISILSYITGEELYFEFKDKSFNNIIPIRGSKNAKDEIKGLYPIFDDRSKSRKHEIKSLCMALNNVKHRSELLIFLSPILVYDKLRKHVTDLDGIVLGFKEGQLKVLLVEAKKQKHCSISAAKEQLETTISHLKFKTSEKQVINTIPACKSAYCYFGIDGIS
ncbi:hypothetical protein [Methanobacterium formicicum]|uniref:Uncharacterized protein n=1 Tax=Methanobacterium formicicum TaxID=2162 RepID=A0A843ANN8_METFO|nr:hypothetical protein [Methanobacterium formicicum]MBF4475458.1 hypothetical protein [Methanobacterium formicicum]